MIFDLLYREREREPTKGRERNEKKRMRKEIGGNSSYLVISRSLLEESRETREETRKSSAAKAEGLQKPFELFRLSSFRHLTSYQLDSINIDPFPVV